MFDAYTGTYNDLCHIICYFRKLQAPRSALVCGATCGMHVFAGFVDKFFGHFRPEIGYSARQSGSRNLYKMLPIYSSSIWHKAFDQGWVQFRNWNWNWWQFQFQFQELELQRNWIKGIGIGIGIDKEELKELIQFLFLTVNSFWFFAMFLAESLNQFDPKPFWIQLTRI